MTRRVPVLATLIVALAVLAMIALGLWQLARLDEKEAQLARYQRAQAMSAEAAWPTRAEDIDGALYRRSRVDCARVLSIDTLAGHAASGETGWAHIARCALPGGGTAAVAIGWAREPVRPQWEGGRVDGIVGPYRNGAKLVAVPARAGLAQLALPDPRDVPNNHLSYAVQWFLFALTALVIYVLALRKRWRSSAA
ncbi:SURF1 family protein [Tsuneonella sp. YG55]|uniref:SURF1-like protein n=1 Tax=Tsuneonella litorea TaxID=2976475 RepID=A0A9X3A7L2_9SPHN|nr:SURF1 family cytochrome oxidase biogenesis protein [Tsuneonella litorea]MCT2558526.1 SURF1 family protein [Tsuneonella litorea]